MINTRTFIITLAALLLVPLGAISAAETHPPAEAGRAVIERLRKGINTDFSPLGTNPEKVHYDPAYFDAAKAAGFESVRFFINYTKAPGVYDQVVKDALDRGLVVVLCMWASNTGQEEFARQWEAIARHYKDYPESLAFELFNEPQGSKVSDPLTAMRWCNAAIPAIRKSSPARTILVGGPQWNQIEMLSYLSPDYLPYRLPDGTGFAEDQNLVGACHYYLPLKFTHSNGILASLKEHPAWKGEITQRLDLVSEWSRKWRKHAVMTEWGVQTAPKIRSELLEYIRFMHGEIARRNIGLIYYCGPFSNEWGFSIFDSEWGWDRDIVEILTGVQAPAPPPTNPLLNPEFDGITRWKASDNSRVSVADATDLSGTHALKVTLTGTATEASVFQETDYEFSSNEGTFRHSKKALLHLRKGNTYRLTFLARAEQPGAFIKARFEKAGGAGPVYWTSNPVAVDTRKKEYGVEYAHTGGDVQDMRLTILFQGNGNTVYFDKVGLKSARNSHENNDP